MKTALVTLMLISCCVCASSEPDCETYPPFQLISTFEQGHRVYQVAFIQKKGMNGPWSIDLVMRWRDKTGQEWHETAKVPEVLLEKAVRLAGSDGNDIEAVVVSNPGASARFISVIGIDKSQPGFRILLNREWDKWNFDYRFDTEGKSIGLQFHYNAWHLSPDGLTGHVYAARNIGWVPTEHEFHRGPVYVDDQREQEADLAEVLSAIGAQYLLNFEESYDESSHTYTIVYKPEGLLWRKTPPELRLAKKVKVVISWRGDSAVVDSMEVAD